MKGMRKAAAALHGMSDTDRALLLAELGEQERTVLQGYLAELDALGFARLPDGMAAEETDLLSSASADTMVAVLAGEPESLLAQVLALRPWPWRAALLAAQPAPCRERLAQVRPGPVAPALAALLLAELAAAVQHAPAPPPAAPRRRRWPWSR